MSFHDKLLDRSNRPRRAEASIEAQPSKPCPVGPDTNRPNPKIWVQAPSHASPEIRENRDLAVTSPFTVRTLAARWECSESLIRKLITKNELVSFRIGRALRISADEVGRFECAK